MKKSDGPFSVRCRFWECTNARKNANCETEPVTDSHQEWRMEKCGAGALSVVAEQVIQVAVRDKATLTVLKVSVTGGLTRGAWRTNGPRAGARGASSQHGGRERPFWRLLRNAGGPRTATMWMQLTRESGSACFTISKKNQVGKAAQNKKRTRNKQLRVAALNVMGLVGEPPSNETSRAGNLYNVLLLQETKVNTNSLETCTRFLATQV